MFKVYLKSLLHCEGVLNDALVVSSSITSPKTASEQEKLAVRNKISGVPQKVHIV